MRNIYFLTIDRVKDLDKSVKPIELIRMRNEICIDNDLSLLKPYQVFAFEFKEDKKNGKRLHYHMLASSPKSFIKYTGLRHVGWSIKLVKLKTHYDVANTAGYIQKNKYDKDLREYNKTFKKFKVLKVNTLTP